MGGEDRKSPSRGQSDANDPNATFQAASIAYEAGANRVHMV
jgi:hypothetical protein